MLQQLFTKKLEVGVYKTLMQSLYLCLVLDYDTNLLAWLDCLSEGFFIKS